MAKIKDAGGDGLALAHKDVHQSCNLGQSCCTLAPHILCTPFARQKLGVGLERFVNRSLKNVAQVSGRTPPVPAIL
eukprot:CAMPEP_0172180886 /NCGR_PEP_ID=MMETSP1050-20130122/17504_1 /TAXON_ID=233186 /ORGANISM="Cryptomonas curvata, Strain CCAP979/52" /LENGTH=75 /DNA_ID=CAMNT_0012854093 /DNA_START=3109 /DNA_END=3336 /DNA_ORIENTATION=-